jgi:hypothetical protein
MGGGGVLDVLEGLPRRSSPDVEEAKSSKFGIVVLGYKLVVRVRTLLHPGPDER